MVILFRYSAGRLLLHPDWPGLQHHLLLARSRRDAAVTGVIGSTTTQHEITACQNR
jgi:hypothetical protein